MRPNALVAGAMLRRGALLWLGVRAVASAVFFLGDVNPLHLAPEACGAMVAVATMAGLAQTWRLREFVFIANLGVTLPMVASLFGAAAAAGELLVLAAGRLG